MNAEQTLDGLSVSVLRRQMQGRVAVMVSVEAIRGDFTSEADFAHIFGNLSVLTNIWQILCLLSRFCYK